jgi:Fe-S oxidoreductase
MSLERLEKLRGEMQKCTRCSLCKLVPMPTIQNAQYTSACPPLDEYHFHAYCGGGLQVMALALLDGRIQVDQTLADIVAACTTCGMCDVCCKFIMEAERQQVIMALKEYLVQAGYGPEMPQAPDDDAAPRGFVKDLDVKRLPGARADVLLYAGAAARQDPQQAATARKLALLLRHAGVDFGVLGDAEPDCGLQAYWTGHRQVFERQAEHVVNLLDQTGVKTIVSLCGADLGILRAKYPEYVRAPQANVLHASEFLQRLIDKGKLPLTRPVNKKVTYHDPCYLGRQSEPPQEWEGEERLTHGVMTYFVPPKPINYGVNGVFEPPRQILRAVRGLELVEMYRVREYAFCCGGGGGVPQAHPRVARSAALQRLDEARDVGAEALVTACHHCRQNLLRWQGDDVMPILDLVDVVYEAAGLATEGEGR